MTAEIWTNLPLRAGGAAAQSAGRTLAWGFAGFMRAPLRNSGLAALVCFSALAGSNALYFQHRHHPAPLFGAFQAEVTASIDPVEPVVPASRHLVQYVPTAVDSSATGSLAPAPTDDSKPIGNAAVFEVQRKLQAFQLFDASVDGYYGPRTAHAIRAFEQRLGLKPTGELTQDIVDLILSTPIIAPKPEVKQLATPEPLPQPAAIQEPEPLPAPQPLLQAGEPAMQPVMATVPEPAAQPAGRELPATPEQAFDVAVAATGDAIDTIISGVQTMTMTKPNNAPKSVANTILSASVDAPQSATADAAIVANVQRGLSSLGFLHGTIDGVPGEATAKAIRNFEVYYNYQVTGRITPGLVNLLVENGAVI